MTSTDLKQQSQPQANGSLDVDVDVLQAKYDAERNKRLRNGGPEQYHRTRPSNFNDYLRDPYVKAGFAREPIKALYDVVIVGAGYTGVQVAARLIAKGYTNICVIEKGGDVGGTWYWNRYPGIQCDIDAYIYMPLLEEIGVIPTQKYVSGTELFQHAKRIAEHYGIYQHTLLQTELRNMTWDESTHTWKIETDRKDDIRTQWIIPAQGPLHTPKFPGIPGISSFKGHSFHSSRWDYTYTGGSTDDSNLVKLKTERVGIIGTGATAIQIVPAVAKWAKELYVFQRTPSAVNARNNKPTDIGWARSLPRGWQQKRMENFTTIVNGGQTAEDMVDDGWTEAIRSTPGFFGTGNDDSEDAAKRLQIADFRKMESVRQRVDSIVKDKATAEALKPYYKQFCKRPCFHDEYLQAFNKENVHLVDTQGQGVEAIAEAGVVASGKTYALDCIIFAQDSILVETSARTTAGLSAVKGSLCRKSGKMGLQLSTAGLLSAPNPNWTHSMVEMITHLLYLIDESKKRNIKAIEPSEEAESLWVREAVKVSEARSDFLKECTPGYYNNEGKVDEKTLRAQPYGGGGLRFNKILTEWRNEGNLTGMVCKTEDDVVKANGTSEREGSVKVSYVQLELL